ncbi:hypothetical protein QBC37DRAFT_401057 [Rhypophila decipiens]|uniref:Uncharacterized protein n=1 Tax=Rhypophila decipiens TaxID=261697 RepID=A0AAN6Y664_9PEZI|nr:hypothetical protein QBC37DRAFT_401057 [Rhypophila decipiens]
MTQKRNSLSDRFLWLTGTPRDKWEGIKSKVEKKYNAMEDFAVEQTAWRDDVSPAARRLRARAKSGESPEDKLNKRIQELVGPRDPPPASKPKKKAKEGVSQICLVDKDGQQFWYDGAPGLEAVKAKHDEMMKEQEEKKEREQKEKMKKKDRNSVKFDLSSRQSPEKKEPSKQKPQSQIPKITVTDTAETDTNKDAAAKGAESGWTFKEVKQRNGSPDSGSSGETVRGTTNKPPTPPATYGRPVLIGSRPPPAYESVYHYLADAVDKQPHHTVYPVPAHDSSQTLPQPNGFSAFRPHKDVPPSLAIAPPVPRPPKHAAASQAVPDTPFLNQKSPETEYVDGVPDWSHLPSQRKVREQNRETYLLDKATTSGTNSFDLFKPPAPRNVSAPQKLRTPPKIKRKPLPATSPLFANVGLGISQTMPELSPPLTPSDSPVPAPLFARRPRPPGWDQIQKWSGPNGSQASSVAGSVAGSVCGDAGGPGSASEYATAKSGLSSPAVSAATSDPYSVGSMPGKWAPSVSTLSETDSAVGTNESSHSSTSKKSAAAANHICGWKCYATGCCADMVGDNKAFLVGTGYHPPVVEEEGSH